MVLDNDFQIGHCLRDFTSWSEIVGQWLHRPDLEDISCGYKFRH
jgi:hypothetical protein